MATSGPTQLPAFFSTDSDFRTWVAGIHTALAAVGLTNTADTGQINSGTVLKPAGSNTVQGFEVWRFSDALQATLPVFIKVEYGSGGVVDRPAVWITVGTTTNGSGTLGGQLSTRTQVAANASKTAGATLPLYASGATDRIHIGLNLDFANTNSIVFWGAERTKDSTGANTADGYVAYTHGGGATTAYQAIPSAGAASGIATGPCVPTNSGGRSAVGADVGIGPGVYFLGKPFYALLVGHLAADIGGASTFTATVLGATHTFLSLSGAGGQSLLYGNPTGHTIAMLWE